MARTAAQEALRTQLHAVIDDIIEMGGTSSIYGMLAGMAQFAAKLHYEKETGTEPKPGDAEAENGDKPKRPGMPPQAGAYI